MFMIRSPKKLCQFCLIYVTDTHSHTYHPIYKLDGSNTYEILTGDTPDISESVELDW